MVVSGAAVVEVEDEVVEVMDVLESDVELTLSLLEALLTADDVYYK